MIISTNCTKPRTGWGSLKEVDIYLFESVDGKHWSWRSKAASGLASAGEEGANENDMVVAADGSLLIIYRTDGGDGWPVTTLPFFPLNCSLLQ